MSMEHLSQQIVDELEGRLNDPLRLSVAKEVLATAVPDTARVLMDSLARELGVVMAAVTVIDEHKQHVLTSSHGAVDSCLREDSKCQYVIGSGHMVAVNNVSGSWWRRVSNYMLPNGEPLQAYLGVPLRIRGQVLGAVCVVDDKPRTWTAQEHYRVVEVARLIMAILED